MFFTARSTRGRSFSESRANCRRESRYWPRPEILEARTLLSANAGAGPTIAGAPHDAAFSTIEVFKTGSQLTIIGSNRADQIDVTVDDRGVTVASPLERAAPLTIPGIDQVIVETGAGDDTLSLRFEATTDQNFRFLADLGRGDDTFNTVLVAPGPCTPGETPALLAIAARGGAGDDTFNTDLVQPGPCMPEQVSLDGEAGDDTFNTVLVQPGPCMPGEAPVSLGVAARGGAGNDTFNTVLVAPGPCIPVQVSLDGGTGDDHLTTAFLGSDEPPADGDPPSPVDLNVQGGGGRDDIRVIFGFNPQPDPPAQPSVFLNTPVHAQLDGGQGDDDIRVIYGFNPQPDPPAVLFINAPMDIAADGGQGDDDIRVIYGFNPQPDPPATPSVVVTAPVNLTLDGGAGDDLLLADFQSLAMRGGELDATLNGGAGNDVVAAFFTLLDGAADPGRVLLLGGAGDDVLALQVLGAAPTTRADLLVDGGSGFDIARVSAGVDVVDCEAIISASVGR